MQETKIIGYEIKKVGKHLKGTKVKHSWKFYLHSAPTQVDLFVSKISGKREIRVDGRTVYQTHKRDALVQFCAFKDNNCFSVSQRGSRYELRINNTTFSQILKESSFQLHTNRNKPLEISEVSSAPNPFDLYLNPTQSSVFLSSSTESSSKDSSDFSTKTCEFLKFLPSFNSIN